MIPLQHRAAQAMAAIDTAKTPAQQYAARQEGLGVKADLEKQIGDDKALDAFRKTQPKSMAGIWSDPVVDHPMHMTGPAGTKITAPIALPDGSRAAPNPQYQIVVPARFVPAMVARGFVLANSVITNLDTTMPDPVPPNA